MEKRMNLKELKKEYATQDNRRTAYPIYVVVQELFCIGVMKNGYSANCPYGDDETKIEYRHEDYEDTWSNKQELIDQIVSDNHPERAREMIDNEIEELTVGYIWVDREFFLTIKGAEEYMKANAHNHGKLRTYVKWFEDRNFEMRNLLKELGFRIS